MVLPNLWVGSLSAVEDNESLQQHGVTHILTVAGRLQINTSLDVVPESNRLTIDVDDHPSENLLEHFREAIDFIQGSEIDGIAPVSFPKTNDESSSSSKGKRIVLVHCASGISRSVAVCCAYLMAHFRLSFDEALEKIRVKRPLGNPNFGFHRQLRCLERCQVNLQKALELYKKLEKEESSTDAVRNTREKANDYHRHVDTIEEHIMSLKHDELLRDQDGFIMRLSVLQNQIDNYNTDHVRQKVGDRPTKTILKSASSKANRLLGKLYSLDDNTNPYKKE